MKKPRDVHLYGTLMARGDGLFAVEEMSSLSGFKATIVDNVSANRCTYCCEMSL